MRDTLAVLIDGDTTTLHGIRIVVSKHALRETTERLFPASRHRSRRIHKTLVKRHGSVFRRVPAIWKTPEGLFVHPQEYAALRAALRARMESER